MFTWVRLPAGRDATRLLPGALAADVAFVPGTPFYAADPDPATLRLSFTTHTPDEIAEGMRRLASVIRQR
jgi:2-aminoadipate transaminase